MLNHTSPLSYGFSDGHEYVTFANLNVDYENRKLADNNGRYTCLLLMFFRCCAVLLMDVGSFLHNFGLQGSSQLCARQKYQIKICVTLQHIPLQCLCPTLMHRIFINKKGEAQFSLYVLPVMFSTR